MSTDTYPDAGTTPQSSLVLRILFGRAAVMTTAWCNSPPCDTGAPCSSHPFVRWRATLRARSAPALPDKTSYRVAFATVLPSFSVVVVPEPD